MKALALPLLLLAATPALAGPWQPVPRKEAERISARLNDLTSEFARTSRNCRIYAGLSFLSVTPLERDESHFLGRIIPIAPGNASGSLVQYFRREGQPVLLVRNTEHGYLVRELLVTTDASERSILELRFTVRELVATTDGPLTNPVRRERWEVKADLTCR